MVFGYPTISRIDADTPNGFYKIENDAYHASAGISSTRVKDALAGYARYTTPREQTDAMAFGTAFHAALLEPHVWAKYQVSPDVDKRSKAYKDWVASLPDGASLISYDDAYLVRSMVDAVKSHPQWTDTSDHNEVAAVARFGNQLVKCKADSLGDVIIDFKTTSGKVTPGAFMRSVVDFGYHISAAFYQDVFAAVAGVSLPFRIVAIAKNPVDVEIYDLSPELLEEGRKLYKAGLKRIARWEADRASVAKEKRIRVLHPTQYLLYNTTETLEFIGD